MPAVTRFTKNKYYNAYFRIIDFYKSAPIIDGYYEKHHIIPKCMGGTNKKSNIVLLTAKAHFVCHHLLTKFTTGNDYYKMLFSYNCFLFGFGNAASQRENTYRFTSSTYEYAKKQLSIYQKANSHFRKDKGNYGGSYWMQNKTQEEIDIINSKKAHFGESNGFYGKTHSDHSKKKAVKTRLDKYGTYHPNHPVMSEEARLRASDRMKNNNPAARKIVINGVEYVSISSASTLLNIKYRKLYRIVTTMGNNIEIDISCQQ